MPRFFYSGALAVGAEILLPDKLVRHLQVLRMEAGDEITLFNGEGGQYLAVLATLDRKEARAVLRHFSPRDVELPFMVAIAQALPEGAKMDGIIEKCVELGAACIQPLQARRSVVRLSGERATKRLQHWEGIVIAASEQCGRNRLARVYAPCDFTDWASHQDLHRRILLSPRADQSLADWAAHHPPQALTIVVGPEGGFSTEEEELAGRHGMLSLAMGPRVLRTETAAMAALATLNAHWDRA